MRVNGNYVALRASEWAWLVLMSIGMLFFATESRAGNAYQRTFATPEDAASALVQVVKVHDRTKILGVLGGANDWVSSGDPVADRAIGDRFVAAYEVKHSIVGTGDKLTLTVGNDEYPFAFPIVKSGERWRFDTEAGKEELLAIVDAQLEYASQDRNGDGVLVYAQKFSSSQVKHDGTHCPTEPGEHGSP